MNPYRLADARQRRARRRVEGGSFWLGTVLPVAAAAGAVWLARDVYGALLGGGTALRAAGFVTLVTRVGLLLAALLSLSAYDTVIRGPDRGVLDLHPLLPRPWLAARAEDLVRRRLPWLAVATVFLVPLLPDLPAFALGIAVLAGAWAGGIATGLGVNLAAPLVGARPELAGILDTIRGHSPRLQAALLYAPGTAVAIAGVGTLVAAEGAGRALTGDLSGIVGIFCPVLVVLGGGWLAVRSAPQMPRVGAILGEIDAAWAAAETPEEARAVYLEWIVRLAPSGVRLALGKELRHLWRAHRAWVTGSWALALLAGISGWTNAADGPMRLARVGTAALCFFGVVGVRLPTTDPAWLDAWLRVPGRVPGRALALFACMQPIVLVGCASLLVRQGVAMLPVLPRLELAAVVLAGLSSVAGYALRTRAILIYAPAALLAWALGGAG